MRSLGITIVLLVGLAGCTNTSVPLDCESDVPRCPSADSLPEHSEAGAWGVGCVEPTPVRTDRGCEWLIGDTRGVACDPQGVARCVDGSQGLCVWVPARPPEDC